MYEKLFVANEFTVMLQLESESSDIISRTEFIC